MHFVRTLTAGRAAAVIAAALLLSLGSQRASAANTAPVISGTPSTTVKAGSPYYFKPTASDANGDVLRFRIANRPIWATFEQKTGVLRGSPSSHEVGKYANIVISVTDGYVSRSLPAFTITVTATSGTNGAPVISGTPPSSVTAGQAYAFQPTATDPNGNTLSFSIQNKPVWATFSTATGKLSGTPASSQTGTYSNIQIKVSDGALSDSLAAFSITVTSPTSGAPSISGTPPSSVVAGQLYSFQPTASDPNGDPLTFSIQNKPAWATFSATTGKLSGTPTAAQVGSYGNIVISASDGTTSRSLPAFAIAVTQTANGSVTLSWQPPTKNTDGTPLTNLAGYRVYYGLAAGQYTQTVSLPNPGLSSVVIEGLSPTRWYFAIKAYNGSGVESAYSASVSYLVQ